MMQRGLIVITAVTLFGGCTKVPINDIEAGFEWADAAWFEDEETLFFFYELSAEPGLSENSQVEVTYRTDDEVLDWTAANELPWVHTHLPVDCGFSRICGSLSLNVPIEPRNVGIRLRYHRDGAVFLDTGVTYNTIESGPPYSNRSFLVYGVFTEDNRRVQWRGRHRFPTLRNEEAQALGLRRWFRIENQRYGTADLTTGTNPYGYAAGCPPDFVDTDFDGLETEDRAIFNSELLALEASEAASVCAQATVRQPKAPFVSTALARKNPEVEPAFPLLRTPVKNATPIKFYLAPCTRTISREHDAMQRQRLLYGMGETYCTEDWESSNFVPQLVADFRNAIDTTRADGNDMVLVIGLHRDEAGVADRLEEALRIVLPPERDRSTPRLAGAFVFDSSIRDLVNSPIERLVLWCPANLPAEIDGTLPDPTMLPDPSQISCGFVPDDVRLEESLGPFTISALPILSSRTRYLRFIDQFGEGQAGEVRALNFLAPEFTPTTDNIDLEIGIATFFNGERITATPEDAFSYCETGEISTVVFRTEIMRTVTCPDIGEPDDDCVPGGLLPIALLPDWHDQLEETTYELGLGWDFPWLLRMRYEVVGAANVSAFGLSVPFGVGVTRTDNFGSMIWTADEFPLDERLLHCKRFCDHPTFDSAGVYNVRQSFRGTYRNRCYLPRYPMLGDSSFPLDP